MRARTRALLLICLLALVAAGVVLVGAAAAGVLGRAGSVPGEAVGDRGRAAPARETLAVGVLVCAVSPDGPAARSGVRVGDRLVALGGQPLDSYDALAGALRAHRPGDRVPLAVEREEGGTSVMVALGEREGRAFLGLTGCTLGEAPTR